MNKYKMSVVVLAVCILFIKACITDPIIPPGGIPSVPGPQDPGPGNVCENGVISFQHQVLPIMVSACAYSGCHDAINAEDDVVLDNYENVRKEVKPGDPNDSELYESIVETDPDDIMPPPPAAKLSSEQISIIRDWINQGANNTDCGTPCDPMAASFSQDIFPIVERYCLGCHNDNREDGNVNLKNYDKIKPLALNGDFLGTIKAELSFPVMPPSGSRLSTCRIGKNAFMD